MYQVCASRFAKPPLAIAKLTESLQTPPRSATRPEVVLEISRELLRSWIISRSSESMSSGSPRSSPRRRSIWATMYQTIARSILLTERWRISTKCSLESTREE